MSLSFLGWDASLADAFSPFAAAGFTPARVTIQHKHAYVLRTVREEWSAECTGRFLHAAATPANFPAVGDWVAMRARPAEALADIHAVLPRRTKFSRRAAGDAGAEQIVAANVDTVFLVTALDQNFNLRRIERYLAVAWESGAQPVVVLNKADLHPAPETAHAEVSAVAAGAPVIVLSALGPPRPPLPTLPPRPLPNSATRVAEFGKEADEGVERAVERGLGPWLVPGRTVAFLGSSGVGKSTLINRLLGAERQRTVALSDAVGKGRHTTTHRELIVGPSGVLVIDTPGMRELQLWDVDAGALDTTFADLAALAARCRFRDCTHRAEPGCAVQAALETGSLDLGRWQSYQKLQREQAYAARRVDPRLARESKEKWKKIHKAHRALSREPWGDE
jgi:ribosome biogenesis GTPase